MTKLLRPIAWALVVGVLFSVGVYGLSHKASGGVKANAVFAQTSAPSASTPGTSAPSTVAPSTSAPSQPPAQKPITASPLPTIQVFFDAVQAGDMDIVSNVTGGAGAPGVDMWCSKGLSAYVGHTTFGKWRSVITHNDGLNACVNIDGFMRFTDPGGFPSVVPVTHWYIDGDFKLKASGDTWVITSLPGYEEPLCDGPHFYGPDPYLFPWHGDAI